MREKNIENKIKWVDIPNYKGLYQVSNFGEVRSLDHYASNGKTTILYKGKILKPNLDSKKNYLYVTLSKNNQKQKYLIHRLVAENFLTNSKNKKEVNHINGIKTDNRVLNLEWVTSKENKQHAIKMGLYNTDKFKNRKPRAFIKINGLTLKEIAVKEDITYYMAYNKYVRYKING